MASNLELILKGLRHSLYKRLNRDIVGYVKEADLPPISLADIRAYAEATGEDPDNYTERSNIPPLFVSRLIHPYLMELILKPELRMNILKMVHGELSVRWMGSATPLDRLSLRMEVKEIQDTSAGELLRILFLLRKGEESVAEATAGLLVRGERRDKTKKEEEEKRGPIREIDITTRPDQAIKYARASLDNNLIHTSYLFARIAGLKRPILHGVCVFAMTLNELIKAFAKGDRSRIVAMSGRFAYPVYPGETIRLRAFGTDRENLVEFEVLNGDGKKNIKYGRFEFKI
jgi:acyl dehydratase